MLPAPPQARKKHRSIFYKTFVGWQIAPTRHLSVHPSNCTFKDGLRGANKAEAIVLVAVVRVVVVTVSNLAVVGVVIPRAATLDTVIARRRTRSPSFC